MQASYRQKCKFTPEAVCCCLQICNFGFPTPSLQSLVRAAGRPDWESIQDIDVPPFQQSLSRAIHETSFDALLASATHPPPPPLQSPCPLHSDPTRWRLAQCCSFVHLRPPPPGPGILAMPSILASLFQTILGIIMWVVGEMPIESSGTTLCGMQFFQRHSQPPSRPARKFLPSSRAPRIVPLMFTYPAGKEAAQPR